LENWRVLPFQIFDAFENMATDEALFRSLQERGGPPTLRFYGWEKPALSIGYFQSTATEINLHHCRRDGMDVVRRPTGGKAVLHDCELTYAVVSREGSPFFSGNLVENYRAVCSCLIRAFAELGIEVTMARECRHGEERGMSAICFAFPAPFELLSRGRKICGSAQVRSRGCFLQHGSILLDFDAEKSCRFILPSEGRQAELCSHLSEAVTSVRGETGEAIRPEPFSGIVQRAFETSWNVRFAAKELTPEEDALKNRLLETKYRNPAWNLDGRIQGDRFPSEPFAAFSDNLPGRI
jgi:lipoate-protein ligase A